MIITASEVPSVQRLVNARKTETLVKRPIKFTLGAILEIACCWCLWQKTSNWLGTSLIEEWLQASPELRECCEALRSRGLKPVADSAIFGKPTFEVCSAPLWGQWESDEWAMFGERFSRSLKDNGFGASLSKALSKAMVEMADNVTQHSGPDVDSQANGIIAFHVQKNCMTYGVADIGRGILNSLQSNPHWSGLKNSSDALLAAISGATSRVQEVEGAGFKLVQDSLMDLNGCLRFRSGDGCVTLNGRNADRKKIKSYTPELDGFQISVTCSINDTISEVYF